MKNKLIEFVKDKPLIAGGALAGILLAISLIVVCIKILTPPLEDILYLKSSSFEKLDNWEKDNQQQALTAFEKSCARIKWKNPEADFGVGNIAGKSKHWQEICNKLGDISQYTPEQARQFFEENFNIYEARGKNRRKGLFTGYYEPILHGSLTKSDKYNIPVILEMFLRFMFFLLFI